MKDCDGDVPDLDGHCCFGVPGACIEGLDAFTGDFVCYLGEVDCWTEESAVLIGGSARFWIGPAFLPAARFAHDRAEVGTGAGAGSVDGVFG